LTDDSPLYQTERWANGNFQYILPINKEGKYVLILKFSEVFFNSAADKIFDIGFGDSRVINKLDIYSKVGKSTACDEYIEFELKNDKIIFEVKIFFLKNSLIFPLIFLFQKFILGKSF